MALQTLGDIRNDILVKLNQSTTVAFYTDAILTTWISNAHTWAASKYKWPMTEGRYETTFVSVTNGDGYTELNYPEGFKSNSIRLLTIGGKHFLKKNFYKFQSFLEDNSGDSGRIYTDRGRTIYINPTASNLSGTAVMWGQYNVPVLDDTDPTVTTVFTGAEEDGNEAIVEKVLSWAMTREKSPVGFQRGHIISAATLHAQNADQILDAIWQRIQAEQYAYQDTLDEGIYKRFDVLRGGFKEDIFKRDQWYS